MSADVYIHVIRKEDGCPYERIYLGGNRLRDEIIYDNNPLLLENTVMGCRVYKFDNAEKVQEFIDKHLERIKAYADLTEFDYYSDDFFYWLGIEE